MSMAWSSSIAPEERRTSGERRADATGAADRRDASRVACLRGEDPRVPWSQHKRDHINRVRAAAANDREVTAP